MLQTAKHIVESFNGRFPDNYLDILNLKGVGPYTAAAISSFAFDLPHAVVDGNVIRILARYFGIYESFGTALGKRRFFELANQLLPKNIAAEYNQAIMDFGALVCKPANPFCLDCPLNDGCFALDQHVIKKLPVKSKKTKRSTRYFAFLVAQSGDDFLLERRVKKDIWKGLYQFPLIEQSDGFCDKVENYSTVIAKALGTSVFTLLPDVVELKQKLTHQTIKACFIRIILHREYSSDVRNYIAVPTQKMGNFAYPRVIYRYLQALFEQKKH